MTAPTEKHSEILNEVVYLKFHFFAGVFVEEFVLKEFVAFVVDEGKRAIFFLPFGEDGVPKETFGEVRFYDGMHHKFDGGIEVTQQVFDMFFDIVE